MRTLSKSKLLAYRQCSKRLWLEIHHPERREDSAATQASFAIGDTVGDIARRIYDVAGNGVLLDAQRDGFNAVFQRSLELLATEQPIFEAGYAIEGALAFADVMLPLPQDGQHVWRMVEVKSSTRVKDYHRDDAAIQAYIARQAGVPLVAIAVAHIDNQFVYPGEGNYRGLLKECDLTEEAFARADEVGSWIADAHKVTAMDEEPQVSIAAHCGSPFMCGFFDYCESREARVEYPVHWLPYIRSDALKTHLADNPCVDLRHVPDELLSELQRRVKTHTLSGEPYFNAEGSAAMLKQHELPAYFLDFETIYFAVPIWKGTRPYQQMPFQFSLHTLHESGKLESKAHLDLSGNDPRRAFAEALVAACPEDWPVFVYNAGFEGARIDELAGCFPDLASRLFKIRAHLVDLHPITKANYYHPSQQGSWSIKAVLPAVAPDLSYEDLEGVQNGGMAMDAYLEATHPDTLPERKAEIAKQLLAYCALDTFAMVRLWQFLAGRNDMKFKGN
jgi:hypothetical protein